MDDCVNREKDKTEKQISMADTKQHPPKKACLSSFEYIHFQFKEYKHGCNNPNFSIKPAGK